MRCLVLDEAKRTKPEPKVEQFLSVAPKMVEKLGIPAFENAQKQQSK